MHKIIVIGVAGKARSGKTFLSKAIETCVSNKHPELPVHTFAFADVLKDECANATGIDRKLFDDPVTKEILRPLMQWWGTDFKRNPMFKGYSGYWVDKFHHLLVEKFHGVFSKCKNIVIVIPDVRFVQEVNYIHTVLNGYVVNLVGLYAKNTPHSSHASEAGVDPMKFDKIYATDHALGITDLDRIAENIYDEFISKRYSSEY
jgi:hypothetical protein